MFFRYIRAEEQRKINGRIEKFGWAENNPREVSGWRGRDFGVAGERLSLPEDVIFFRGL